MFKPEIRNKARQMLGLQYEPYQPTPFSFTPRRSNSTSSCSSYDALPSPSSSSLPSIPSSPSAQGGPPSKNEVFEKLKKIVPSLRNKSKPLHSIMAAVSEAMLEEEENEDKPPTLIAEVQQHVQEPALPLDLQNVDITAFKILIRSQPLVFNGKLF